MKIVWIQFVAIALLTPALVWAQPAGNSSTTMAFENGSLANHVYANDCLGFSLPIPAAWRLNTQVVGADGKARHAAELLVLLLLDQYKAGSFGNKIVLTARDASSSAPTAEEFVSQSVRTQIDADREHRQMVKDVYHVNYGGKVFSRADYKQAMINSGTLYEGLSIPSFEGSTLGKRSWLDRPRNWTSLRVRCSRCRSGETSQIQSA